jgi:hypothetical protein
MMILVILAGLAVAGWVAGRLAMRAFRDDHLVQLRPHARARAWLFERRGDGRYARITWAEVPAALCRYLRGVPAFETAEP